MKDRIRKLRKELDLTQQKFGERIGIKGNTIAQYEMGRNEPIDAVISLICREFNVNEQWLREGTGEMFVEQTRDEVPMDLVNVLTSLDAEDWKLLIHTAATLVRKKEVIT